jgi:hypothetical protein
MIKAVKKNNTPTRTALAPARDTGADLRLDPGNFGTCQDYSAANTLASRRIPENWCGRLKSIANPIREQV